MPDGFLKLKHSFFSHAFWAEERVFSKAEAWLDMIEQAPKKETEAMIGNRSIMLKPGQHIRSLRQWAERWNWNHERVRRFQRQLIELGMIVTESVTETVTGSVTESVTETVTGSVTGNVTALKVVTLCNYAKHNPHLFETVTEKNHEMRQICDKSVTVPLNSIYLRTKDNKENPNNKLLGQKKVKTQFRAPELNEVKNYMIDLGLPSFVAAGESETFCDYHASGGWMLARGKKMKDWKAAVRYWTRKSRRPKQQQTESQRKYGDAGKEI